MGPRSSLFVSPAGEPFRAVPDGPLPIAVWFARTDANEDGALSYAEFLADFRRWFAALDTDRDGEIAPAEVARYETEILPEMAFRGGSFGGTRRGGRRMGGRLRGGGWHGGGMGMAGGMAGGAARFGLLAIPHPITSADSDFNRGVSRAEFDHAAATRFNLLDEAHSGRLTFAELIARRERRVLSNHPPQR
jgi:hypothetical protein